VTPSVSPHAAVRGIPALADSQGRYAILAIDHRDSLRAALAPAHGSGSGSGPSPTDAEITELKRQFIAALAADVTGVMLEPQYSMPSALGEALPVGLGFSMALEAQGYLDDPGRSPTTILAGWSVDAAQATGAAAAKLLVPYHPDHRLAADQRAVARAVAAECQRVGLPLLLEPLLHSAGGASVAERRRLALTTVEHFDAVGATVLKLPFPVDPTTTSPGDRAAACAAVTERCSTPWVLLSGGGSFESYRQQVAAACDNGCAGFTAGRALWLEAAIALPDQRAAVLRDVVTPRLADLRAAAGLRPQP
jgi:tagatose 1,6-diphosphate aldolase